MKCKSSRRAWLVRTCLERRVGKEPPAEPREAFGVRRIPALCESCARMKAPEYGALQTLRAFGTGAPYLRSLAGYSEALVPFLLKRQLFHHLHDGAINSSEH